LLHPDAGGYEPRLGWTGKAAPKVPVILPEANGAHGHITHVTLYAPTGFDETARRAMDGLRDVWGRGGHEV
jgi:hypothetical protein